MFSLFPPISSFTVTSHELQAGTSTFQHKCTPGCLFSLLGSPSLIHNFCVGAQFRPNNKFHYPAHQLSFYCECSMLKFLLFHALCLSFNQVIMVLIFFFHFLFLLLISGLVCLFHLLCVLKQFLSSFQG